MVTVPRAAGLENGERVPKTAEYASSRDSELSIHRRDGPRVVQVFREVMARQLAQLLRGTKPVAKSVTAGLSYAPCGKSASTQSEVGRGAKPSQASRSFGKKTAVSRFE
jgi:hypothetical protein